MTKITRLIIPIKAFPKPRGKLGKGGHIYHSTPEYVQWNKDFKDACEKASFTPPESTKYYVFKFFHKPGKGHAVDPDNCQGAVQDALVKCGYLKDDSRVHISRWYGEIVVSESNLIELFFCPTKRHFLYVLEKYMSE